MPILLRHGSSQFLQLQPFNCHTIYCVAPLPNPKPQFSFSPITAKPHSHIFQLHAKWDVINVYEQFFKLRVLFLSSNSQSVISI